MKKAHKTLTAIASLALAASLAASLAGCGGKAQDYVFEAEKAELSAACMVETGPEYSAEGSGPEATQVGYFTTARRVRVAEQALDALILKVMVSPAVVK